MTRVNEIFRTVQYDKIELADRIFPKHYVNHLINGDCIEVMSTIPEGSIDLIVTSPPYFVNKAYERDWSFDDYSTLLANCFEQGFRILYPGGYFVVNFGDYFNKDRFYKSEVPSVYPASINYFQWGRSTGFDLQATRIWRKQFSRMGIPMICNDHPRPTFDYEHIWTFRKPDGTGKEFVNDRKKSQCAVLGAGWTSSARLSSHDAAFPIDLPKWAIEVYSKMKGEIVLDPFAGIGTTLAAAEMCQRKFIGIELQKSFCEMAFSRLQGGPVRLTKKVRKRRKNQEFS